MARKQYNGLTTTLGAALASGDTTITFAAALTHSGGTAVPTLSGGDTIALSLLDSSGNLSEIVSLTAYSAGATTGTIARAQESTTAVAHASGDTVVHAPTVVDFTTTTSSGGDTAWTAPTMVNGWVNYDATTGTQAGYRKDSQGRVWLRGLIKSGTTDATIFTLPTGYRPVGTQTIPVTKSAGFASIQIKADGSVVGLGNSATFTYLDGVVFWTT